VLKVCGGVATFVMAMQEYSTALAYYHLKVKNVDTLAGGAQEVEASFCHIYELVMVKQYKLLYIGVNLVLYNLILCNVTINQNNTINGSTMDRILLTFYIII
jgi:hypothetical protein